MCFYLIQSTYENTAVGILDDHPQGRQDVIRKSCESVGGKLHAFYFCFGTYDVAYIAEFPSNEAAAAFAFDARAGGGVVTHHTTVLMTPAEAVKAMSLTKHDSYTPPA